MKKVLFTLAAVAVLAACNKDQIIDQKASEAIRFGNVFVDKATRAAYESSDDIEKFDVYGVIENANSSAINVFCQQEVTKGKDANGTTVWSYDVNNTQYWIPGNTYYFDAVVDGNVREVTEVETDTYGMPMIIHVYDASQQKDVLYAYHNDQGIAYESGQKTVAFTFNHIMSKAKFTVKNAITTDNGYSYKVEDIQITNAVKSSTYACCNAGWNGFEVTKNNLYILKFGDAVSSADAEEASFIGYNESCQSKFERLLIPTKTFAEDEPEEITINVQFVCSLYKDTMGADEKMVPALVNTVTKNVSASTSLEEGHAYNFVISLGNPGEPITFTVHGINEWDTDINHDEVVDNKDDVAFNEAKY